MRYPKTDSICDFYIILIIVITDTGSLTYRDNERLPSDRS